MVEIKLSERAKTIKPGIYEHYKKGRYLFIGVAIHSETLEEMVVYKAMYGKKLVWVRPLSMFLDEVETGGNKKPRFRNLVPKRNS